ncbi:hypothetical protein GF327_04960 [Candidatus Woesearchaeota archaeon]|nr:hypothetical protein [Candidatus Woesearchaeota archaeon]
MKIKKHHLILIIIFLFVFSVRLFFAFQTKFFTDDESYYFLRQIKHIKKTGKLISHDKLSYGGKLHIELPFYYYFISLFSFFFSSIIVSKIIPNLIISLNIFAVYLVSYQISRNKTSSLLSSFFSGFIPILMAETINSINVYSVLVPSMFFLIYYFIRMSRDVKKKVYRKYGTYMIILLSAMLLTSSLSFILVFSLLIYLLLCYIQKIEITRREIEFTLFSLFFYLWLNFIVYKKAFISHGMKVIWKNLPEAILGQFFAHITLWEAIYTIGFIPLIFGVIVIYNYLFKRKSKRIYLLISLCISTFALSWFKLITITDTLLFLSCTLAVLSSRLIKEASVYLRKTRFSWTSKLFFVLIILLFCITSLIPGLQYFEETIEKAPTQDYINTFFWIRYNTPTNSTVLGTIQEGHLISYFSERKNVADTDYLLVKNINTQISDIEQIYTDIYKINALQKIMKYDIDYVLFSRKAREKYNIEKISYIEPKCFKLVYDNIDKIYKIQCDLKNEI